MKLLNTKLPVFLVTFLFVHTVASAQTWKETVPIVSDGFAQIQDVTSDASDNMYAVGYFNTKLTSPAIITANASDRTFLLRADATGAITFSKGISGAGVKGYRVAVDASGNMYVAGSFFGSTIYFDGFTSGTTFGGPGTTNPDGFIAKYSKTGNFLWAHAIGSAGINDEILDMAFDSNGDIYVTGYISGDASVYGKKVSQMQVPSATIASQGGLPGLLDVFVAKFNDDGEFQWGFSLGSTDGAEKGTAIALDASNNVYVAGQLFNTMEFDPLSASGSSILTESSPQGAGDAFIAKYTSAGDYVTVGQLSGASVENVNRMHVGSTGALSIAGSFTGFIDADLRSGSTQNLTAAGTGKDILFASYNTTSFAPNFIQRIGSSNEDDEAIGIKTNSSGDIYLTGYFSGSAVNFNPSGTALNLNSTGLKDMFITKYNAAGLNQWGFKVGSIKDDKGMAMAINAAGMIYASGSYKDVFGDLDPGAGTSTLPKPTIENSFWSKYQECSSTPLITTQPSSQTLCAGTAINLSISATGSGITYKWKKGGIDVVDGGAISGATTATLSITASTSADAGTYTVVATSCGNSVTSANAIITVNSPAVITTQPTAQSICTGATTSFSVSVTGTLPAYQWKLNGAPITNNAIYSGTQAATLNIIGATVAQVGNYSCTITGSCGSAVTSNAVPLTVSNGISITTQPTSSSICIGGTTSISVVATGTSLTYQWQKSGVNLTNGGSISGATSSTLVISGATGSDASTYKTIITSTCGTATTSTAILSITGAPAITSQPIAAQTICAGQSASFSVTATGATTYQWKKGGVDLINAGNVAGATSSTLQLTTVSLSDAGTYTCVITGACAPTVTTSNATLTINSLPAITSQPVSKVICQGLNTSFSVVATGTNLTFKWQRNGVDLIDGGALSGVSTSTLSITAVSIVHAGNYTCIVSGTCAPTITSTIASLTVNSSAVITTNPTDVTSCVGQSATFTLGTSGSGISYQWKKGTVDLVNGGSISGATTSILSISTLTLANAGFYSCTITNTCSGSATSTNASLVVNSLPNITSQPSGVTICGSAPVTFSVSATGTAISYQWKKGAIILTDGATISGATTATLSINPATAADAGAYTCVVSGTCNPVVISNVANLAVGSLAAITSQPISTIQCTGTTANFSSTVSGTGISYQWKKEGVNLVNGGNVSGATSATLTLASVSSSDAALYTLETGNICSGFLTSDPVSLTLNTAPLITTQPVNKNICSGTSTSFDVIASGTSLTYQWKKDGVNLTDAGAIVGSQTANLVFSNTLAADAGSYTVEVSGACPTKAVSSVALLSLAASSSIISQPISKAICTGASTVLTCNATGGSLTYQWIKDGTPLVDGGTVSGATSFKLTLSVVTLSDAGSYVCEVSSTCSTMLTSDAAMVSVSPSSTITAQPSSLTQCEGTSAVFSITVSGTGLTYQWRKGSIEIVGATTDSYTIPLISLADAGSYTCDITTACGLISSIPADLIVNSAIVITKQPLNISACPGDNAVISVLSTGNVTSYKWFKNGVELIDGGNISDATTGVLTISAVSISDADSYSVELSGACGSAITSTIAVLSLSTTPAIITQPKNTLVCTGQPLILTIEVSSAATILYQWIKDGFVVDDNGTTITGATTAILTITNTTAADAGSYTCIVATSCSAAAESDAAIVTTTTSSPITLQPISSSVCKTQSVLFAVEMGGSGLVYKWQFKPNGASVYTDLIESGKYSGVTTQDLVVSNVDITEEGAYRCVITELCGAAKNSAAAALIINSPNIIQHPFPQSICLGQMIQFNVVATGNSLIYQWYKDGVLLANGGRISGVSSATLKITGSQITDNGDYTCAISGICTPNVISQEGTLTVSICTDVSSADLIRGFISMYPKPANQFTYIEIENQIGATARIALFDIQGALIQKIEHLIQTDSEKIVFETSHLPQGMYFMHIQMGDHLFTDKLEVIH